MTRPVGGEPGRMIASAVMLLPQPDSPTMHSVSPRSSEERQVVEHAHAPVVGVELDLQSSHVEKRVAHRSPQLRVERVVQAVADQADREHGEEDARPGKVTAHQASRR